MTWLQRNWRTLLARLPLPLLALAASYGVYRFAALYVPWYVAAVQASAFEATYIGLAITRDLRAEERRRATAISVGAVAVSVLYNSIDGLFARNPSWLAGLPPAAEIAGAVLHGAPLAIVAYLVADLLLHSAPRQTDRPRQLRATVRRLARLLRSARTELRSIGAMLTEARAELRERDTRIAQLERSAAQHEADVRERDATIAQLREASAQPLSIDGIDLLAIGRRLRELGVSSREAAQLVSMSESTLRSRLERAAQNGVHNPG